MQLRSLFFITTSFKQQKMFSTSTQKKFWLFTSQYDLENLRQAAREKFIQRVCPDGPESKESTSFLSLNEERQLCQLVEETAQKFCQSFNPQLIPTVTYTGFSFFKRFYLHNSAMEFLAKNVMMACLYLACKVDEFTVSIDEFVRNLKSGTPVANAEIILSLEAIIMRHLQYHLTVHSPYRPLEGHFIEMKTRCPEIPKVENLRSGCEDFLWRSLLTDVCFLFTPTQIALAAILHRADQLGYDVYSNYILRVLTEGDSGKADNLVLKLRSCIDMVNSVASMTKEASALQARAQQCMTVLDQLHSKKMKRKLREPNSQEDAGSTSKRIKRDSSTNDSDSDT